MKYLIPLALAGLACLGACTSNTGAGGGGTYVPTGSQDSTSGLDAASGTGSQDNSKNKAAIEAKDDSGKAASVSVDKAASKDDTSGADASKKVGAISAGKQLVLFVSTATSYMEVHVNTEKYPLPMNGIPVGEPSSDAWVTYTVVSPTSAAILNSKDKGTIDISVCPDKSGVAAVGKLNGVVVYNSPDSPFSPKNATLTGSFNLVYFGGAGDLMCTVKPVETPKDAGSTTSHLAKGSSCNFQMCDGDPKNQRHCCKYIPCLEPCMLKCTSDAFACMQACTDPMDIGCQMACQTQIASCVEGCFTSCGVDQACKNGMEAVNKCSEEKQVECSGGWFECSALVDACCDQVKAAF